jgi:hypothetical protein
MSLSASSDYLAVFGAVTGLRMGLADSLHQAR